MLPLPTLTSVIFERKSSAKHAVKLPLALPTSSPSTYTAIPSEFTVYVTYCHVFAFNGLLISVASAHAPLELILENKLALILVTGYLSCPPPFPSNNALCSK